MSDQCVMIKFCMNFFPYLNSLHVHFRSTSRLGLWECTIARLWQNSLIETVAMLSTSIREWQAGLSVFEIEFKVVIPVQITTKISGGQPTYFEYRWTLCETFPRFPKITRDLLKIAKDRAKPSEDFRKRPKVLQRQSPEITRRSSNIFEENQGQCFLNCHCMVEALNSPYFKCIIN